MRIKDVVLSLISLALVGAGATLIATFVWDAGSGRGNSAFTETQDFKVPTLEDVQVSASGKKSGSTSGPEDKTLWLTVPRMTRVSDVEIPNAAGNDEDSLKQYAAIHLEDTGFPWEAGSNVYIAGHRLGYPNSDSFLAFYDLDNLQEGDEVVLTDADNKPYTYRVSRQFFASPTDLSVTEPIEGKDLLTLQTCTLPDYSQRLIVQAEKVA